MYMYVYIYIYIHIHIHISLRVGRPGARAQEGLGYTCLLTFYVSFSLWA